MGSGDPALAPRPFEVTNGEVLRIAVPMTLAFLTQPLLGITDTAVIGRLGNAELLAGLVVGALIFDFAFLTFNFVRSGTTGLTAQAFGAEDEAEMQAVFWRAVILALVIGAALVVLQPFVTELGLLAISPEPGVAEATRVYVFWRMLAAPMSLMNFAVLGSVLGRGQATLGLLLQLLINGANIVFSILFGLVLEGGIAGVALGTATGEALGALIGFLVVTRRFSKARRPGLSRILDAEAFGAMIAVNRDIMIRSFCLLGGYALFTRLGAGLGALTLAANGVLLTLFMVGGYFLDGLANASEQLVGRAVGADWRPAFDRAVKLTTLWGLALSGGLALLFLATGEGVVALLTTDAAIRAAAEPYLGWAALSCFSGALAFLMDGVFIGATWSSTMRNMMIVSTLLYAALAYALLPVFGNHGLWFAFQVFLCLRGFTLLAALPARRRATFGA
ncbi:MULTISPECIES: MATE family efflux transporter [unclassified Aureimonas]|uniref:MATE family efflux transporter n=1 Tax=unclassified Aureimonas TaxID=2615206 RepID=UPI0006F2014E|nr:MULTISPECIES: MATE family efflux transporter [unclassified Aureimonas]KQT60672.1 MATE family efflux transporter [Aureimonas sp. Leaf460]KQT68801.1 MATE family efflux transporter [Aureimonas sp. Leaf427]